MNTKPAWNAAKETLLKQPGDLIIAEIEYNTDYIANEKKYPVAMQNVRGFPTFKACVGDTVKEYTERDLGILCDRSVDSFTQFGTMFMKPPATKPRARASAPAAKKAKRTAK